MGTRYTLAPRNVAAARAAGAVLPWALEVRMQLSRHRHRLALEQPVRPATVRLAQRRRHVGLDDRAWIVDR